MKSETPRCHKCKKSLDRIDHYAVEHTILDQDEYRPVAIVDGEAGGGEYGMASETDLRCAYCGEPLRREDREFFYRRWVYAKQATAAIAEGKW